MNFLFSVVCFDAKISFDDNADFRQKEIFAMDDMAESDPREVEAHKYNLNYIAMDGNIACLGRRTLSCSEKTLLKFIHCLDEFWLRIIFLLSLFCSFCVFFNGTVHLKICYVHLVVGEMKRKISNSGILF